MHDTIQPQLPRQEGRTEHDMTNYENAAGYPVYEPGTWVTLTYP
jgi:hypothetical protein